VQNYHINPLPLTPPRAPAGRSSLTQIATVNLLFAQTSAILPVAQPARRTDIPVRPDERRTGMSVLHPALEPVATFPLDVTRAPLQGRFLFLFQEVPYAAIPFPIEDKEAGF
jgi:hypothetical protein